MTHRINIDALENLFSQIRTKGIDDSPTSLALIVRLKMIMLGNNTANLKKHKNTYDGIVQDNVNLNYIIVKTVEAIKLPSNKNVHDRLDC